MENNIKTMNPRRQRGDFQTQWQCRQQWEEHTQVTTPDDNTFLHWAEEARLTPTSPEANSPSLPLHRNKRWIPYVAAASIALGLTIFGLTGRDQIDDGLPMLQEVTVDNQTIHFICNNGCSAQDIVFLANKAIK